MPASPPKVLVTQKLSIANDGLGNYTGVLDLNDNDLVVEYGTNASAFTSVQADFDALPFSPRQFDLVIFNGSLHYAQEPVSTIAAARRMLAPGVLDKCCCARRPRPVGGCRRDS